jgi:DMSO/TMAO reductase YedYZ heme-binding membrane subunit
MKATTGLFTWLPAGSVGSLVLRSILLEEETVIWSRDISEKYMTLTRNGYVILSIVALLLIISGAAIAANPSVAPLTNGIRFAGLAGFVLLAVAAAMTPFSRDIYRTCGKSFLVFHHAFAISGLILITLHPVFLAIRVMNPAVFLPVFSPFSNFLVLAGRPSLILIYVALAGILLRRAIPAYWRVVHGLVWVALILGIIHANLIGIDFANPVIFVIFNGLAIFAAGALVLKRMQRRATAAGTT